MIIRSLFVSLILAVTAISQAESLIPANARVAVIGDSITEQKLYSKYIEAYLLACTGRTDIQVFQFGWSGERASGFAARLKNDLSVFNPTVATTCYGMNDGSYTAYTDAIGAEYEKNMRLVLDGLKEIGVSNIAVGSPGAVDTKFFTRFEPAIYNDNLAHLRDIAKKLAGESNQSFANVHDTMIEAMSKAKPVMGENYDVCGPDGFHPGPNGHLLMAQAFLKALKLDGKIGEITLDLKGQSTASQGHEIITQAPGSITLSSTTWPFCFDADPKASSSNRSILPFTSFNQDLNRLTLVVKGLDKDKAKVTWGSQSQEFTKAQLEAGINLAAEFSQTPFDAAFNDLIGAIGSKQSFETTMIKNMITHFRTLGKEAEGDAEFTNALTVLKKKLMVKHDLYEANVRKRLKAVNHTISVE
ncbi:Lysophospholipase L1 [Prosthecobacter debontii]|uniref:Lysophospholipase L1 n=1 Tax=Prosthecobacter debontii TaxID=48467 RepID=A0A1T4Y403_9BACT|nr:SGNH/GDSL hydrolase family protein [Prosthecobacter debontii]SKA96529.1 Lysophospholipase L1 [Prosthecobacter debontii]